MFTDMFDTIFDAFADPVFVYNPEGIIEKANRAALKTTRIGSGEEFAFVSPFGEPESERSLVSRVLAGGTVGDYTCGMKNDRGEVRHYSCSAAPVRVRDSIAGAILLLHDITETKKREGLLENDNAYLKKLVMEIDERQKLSDKQISDDRKKIGMKDSQIMVSNKLLEIIFSNTHFLIAYLTTGFTIIQVNDAYARAFGQTPAYFAGKNHFVLFPNEKNRIVFEHVVKTGLPHITYGEPFFHQGKLVPGISYWDWSLQPINNGREVEGIILVLIDVSRRKKAEEDLLNSKRLSDIGALAATMAHELRNPLSVIQAAAYNIKRKKQNLDIDKHLENINVQIEESEQIINNLLDYSRVKLPKRSDISIYHFLNELIDDIQGKTANKKTVFSRNYEALKETIIRIDPLQIREVLNNVINNACQSLPPADGRIEIRGDVPDDRRLFLHVIDNGDGIDEEDLEKVFVPFFTNKSRGTGLGLAICKELITLHDGIIEIQSRKGQGTTVTISLPFHVSE